MSIKRTRPKKSRPSSNLTIRMMDDRMSSDRMAFDRMGSDKGPGSFAGGAQNNFPQRSEHVHQEDSSEKK